MSRMGVIADLIKEFSESDTEREALEKEISQYLNAEKNLEDLSTKAFSTVMLWEESEDRKSVV